MNAGAGRMNKSEGLLPHIVSQVVPDRMDAE